MSIDYAALALPKGCTRKQVKARRDRREAAVVKAVRAACVERDGFCRVQDDWLMTERDYPGESEWAHMHQKRRSKTLNQAPEVRHTTADSLMLCAFHHACYDGKGPHALMIEPLTDQGADGPLKFTYRGRSYSE